MAKIPSRSPAIALENERQERAEGAPNVASWATDLSEQTETRKRSPMESVDEDWDIDEPAATKLPSADRLDGAESEPDSPVPVKSASIAPSKLGLGRPEPIKSEPVKSEPAKPVPAKSKSIASSKLGLGSPEPIKSEPVKSEPTKPAPAKSASIAPSKLGLGRPEPIKSALSQQDQQESATVDLEKTDSIKPINVSKFPSALKELAKSDPAILVAASSTPLGDSPIKVKEAELSVGVQHNAGGLGLTLGNQRESARAKVSDGGATPEHAGEAEVFLKVDTSPIQEVAPTAVAQTAETQRTTPPNEPATSVSIAKAESQSVELAAPREKTSSNRIAVATIAHHVVEPLQPSESPSATFRASRPAQESLLSLDTAYAVEFFSSPPPTVYVDAQDAAAADWDAYVPRPRSSLHIDEQLARQRYFRGIVLRVMLGAVALVAFALFVLWRRGVLVW